jgi:hypothetical protein
VKLLYDSANPGVRDVIDKSKEIMQVGENGSGSARLNSHDQRPRIRALPIILLITSLFLILTACGKKAPPFLPQKTFGVKVVNLQAEYQDGTLILKGQLQGLNGVENIQSQVSGCRVYYAQYPLGKPPCPGCPIEFHDYQKFGPEIINDEGFLCKMPDIQTGQIYFLKVLLSGPDGSMGPVSERISIEVQ